MTQEEIKKKALQEFPEEREIISVDGGQYVRDDANEEYRFGYIKGLTEGQSGKETYAEGKVGEYKRELFADFKRRNLYNPTLSFLEMAINSVDVFTPKEDK